MPAEYVLAEYVLTENVSDLDQFLICPINRIVKLCCALTLLIDYYRVGRVGFNSLSKLAPKRVAFPTVQKLLRRERGGAPPPTYRLLRSLSFIITTIYTAADCRQVESSRHHILSLLHTALIYM